MIPTKEISDFLGNINEANYRKSTKPGLQNRYKAIKLEEKLNMFKLSSGKFIDSAYDGVGESESYYIRAEKFLPIMEKLKTEGTAVIESGGFKVMTSSSWDHSYASPDDEGSASIQKGYINGRLRLEGYTLTEYSIRFIPEGGPKELKSDIGAIEQEKIIGVLQLMIMDVNPIATRINERRINFSSTQWEGSCKKLYNTIASKGDLNASYTYLKELIQSDDVNTKIFAIGFIVPIILDVLDNSKIKELSDIIKPQLADNRMCEISEGRCTCADDFDATTVSSAAKDTLGAINKYIPSTK